MPDGTEISLWGRPRYFSSSGEFLIGTLDETDISAERVDVSREQASGIFRVWTRLEITRPSEWPLTDAARSVLAVWHPIADDPVRRCVPPGMARAMVSNPFPIEFLPDGEDIMLRLQEFDTRRVIHMNEDPPGDDTPFTPLGYSIGHWEEEDRTLIVRTTRIDYPLFNQRGVPQSDQVEIEEHFALSEDETELAYRITVNDPVMFTEPVVVSMVRGWIPGVELQAYDCAVLEDRE